MLKIFNVLLTIGSRAQHFEKVILLCVMSVLYIKLLWFSLKHDRITNLVTLPPSGVEDKAEKI